MNKTNGNKKVRQPARRVRIGRGELIRCPLTGQLIPPCCCPVRK